MQNNVVYVVILSKHPATNTIAVAVDKDGKLPSRRVKKDEVPDVVGWEVCIANIDTSINFYDLQRASFLQNKADEPLRLIYKVILPNNIKLKGLNWVTMDTIIEKMELEDKLCLTAVMNL